MRPRLIAFLLFAVALGLLLIVPYRNSLIRLVLLGLWFLTVASLLVLLWPRRLWRLLFLLIIASFAGFLFFPGRSTINTERLRERFVTRLESYDGVRYIYGGENHRGIDCSGLVRAAMVRALIDESIYSLDPGLFRAALHLWWRDSNAIQLGKGISNLTLSIGNGLPRAMRSAEHPTSL